MRAEMVGRKTRSSDLLRRIWQHRVYYLMLIPAVALMVIFAYVPMYGVTIAFKDYSIRAGVLGSKWVGLEHFRILFDMPGFWSAFQNTIVINLLKLLFGFPAPIVLAIMLNAVARKRLKGFLQTCVYLPHFVSWGIIAGMIFSRTDINSGIFSKAVTLFTGEKIDILGNSDAFVAILVISDIWKESGWGAIIYLAALAGLSPEYYEAAKIDGADKVKQFWYITLPLLMPTISIMLILRVGGLIGGGFDQIYNLYNEKVYDKADVLDTFIYRYGIGEGQFEIGTAIGLFTNVINVVLLVIANYGVKLLGGEGLY